MQLFEIAAVRRYWFRLLVVVLAGQGGGIGMTAASASATVATGHSVGLMGEWCREKKRMITQYVVEAGKLRIRGGRSGRTYEANLSCNDAYTVCEGNTVRGWGSPVTEILRLEGDRMHLTRIWGGAWKGKSYDFVFTRCPTW